MATHYNIQACQDWKTGHFALDKKNFKIAKGYSEKAKSSFLYNLKNPRVESCLGHNFRAYTKVTLELGFLLNCMNKDTGALSYYEESLEFAKQIYDKINDALPVILVLNGLGYSLFKLSRFSSALSYFEQASTFAEKFDYSLDKYYFCLWQAFCLWKMNELSLVSEKLTAAVNIIRPDNIRVSGDGRLLAGDLERIMTEEEIQKFYFKFSRKFIDMLYEESVIFFQENIEIDTMVQANSNEYIKSICIADIFDAMVKERKYRKALSLECVFKELIDNKGRDFDSETTDDFLRTLIGRKMVDYSHKDEKGGTIPKEIIVTVDMITQCYKEVDRDWRKI